MLAAFLDIDSEQLETSTYDDSIFELGDQEFMILDENEADKKWEESLDSYIKECIMPDLPDSIRYYFDEEKWKRDARFDGRGHCLSSYDGCENEYEGYYIYRIN
jgi:hypothetical protein